MTLVAIAEDLFDLHGYMATGMDRLTEAAGMSSRTLYKHAGSKAQLMTAVLAERHGRFMQRVAVDSIDALFLALESWIAEGARGCLFLRALAETGGEVPEIVAAVAAHKTAFAARVRQIVAADLGRDDAMLARQIVVLCEGATHAAVHAGPEAVAAARAAAAALRARA